MERLRAVIYNRCSTEEESQKDALKKQVQESKACVAEQGWQLTDCYVEAKSGTTSKGRTEYNRLYQDLERDKFDIIVIKSQDRLMRNTKDWYLFLDRMQKNQKRLYMYLERKFYTPDDALITGIKAILAEEYSRELSKKINNAHRNRQKEGKNFVLTRNTYGLKKLPDKRIVVDEAEADMIRMIFQLSANGYGTHCSAEILYQNGYRNHEGNAISPGMIRKIIRNPIYKGTVIQNRQHYDFESKRIFRNPASEWIIHEHAVPAIVDDGLFEQANKGLDDRRAGGKRKDGILQPVFAAKDDLAGKVFCGLCGEPFYRVTRTRKSGKVIEWKCRRYLYNGRNDERLRKDHIRKAEKGENAGCDNVHINEEKLYTVLEQICRKKSDDFQKDRADLLNKTLTILRKALGENHGAAKKEELEAAVKKAVHRKNILMEKLLDGVISDHDFKLKNQEIQEKLDYFEKQRRILEADMLQNNRLEQRMNDIRSQLENGMIERAQLSDMIGEIRRVDVFPDYLEITFDSFSLMGLDGGKEDVDIRSEADKLTVIRIPQTCSSSTRPDIESEKEQITEMMRCQPKITAKEIAEEMHVSKSRINRRIIELKKEGRIQYSTPNGRGRWMVLDDGES